MTEASLAQAVAALRRGDPAQAARWCRASLATAPDRVEAWRLLAWSCQQLGDPAGARAALVEAHRLRPEDATIAFDLGSLHLQDDDPHSALPLLAQAMRDLPAEPRAGFRYGTAAYLLGDYAAAVEGFRAATDLKPHWLEAWNNLAAAHGRLRDYAPAIAAARQALRLQPDSASCHQALAALLSNLFDRQHLEEGLEAALRAIRLEPTLAAAYRSATIVLFKLGRFEQAEAYARRALVLAPQDPDMVDTLGEQLLSRGRAAEASAVYAAALDSGVATPLLWRQHGVAKLQNGQAREARVSLERALRAQPDDQRAIAHLGVALAVDEGPGHAVDWLGLQRHVHAVDLAPPPGFAGMQAFHDALAADIRRHSQQRWEPVGLAARNAYLSGDLLADRTQAILGFEARLRDAIDRFLAEARVLARSRADDPFLKNIPERYRLHLWATLAGAQGYIDTHIHEESWLSGAYYVCLPAAVRPDDPAHAGWIEFGRPFATLPGWPEGALRHICPTEGRLLLFPSYFFHRTLPYAGAGERISISFDLARV